MFLGWVANGAMPDGKVAELCLERRASPGHAGSTHVD